LRGSVADLPLHSGHVPLWMLKIMKKLAESVVRIIVEERGPGMFVRALSDPFWFQAFNNIIGMDWDSSGSTTVLIYILKDISVKDDLGFLVFGGKGHDMVAIKDEVNSMNKKLGNIDPMSLLNFSKISARSDSAFLLDGYDLYIHSLFVSLEDRNAVTIQQGMNLNTLMARRYHVDKAALEEPHSGIFGLRESNVIDVTSHKSRNARKVFIDILGEGEKRFVADLKAAYHIANNGKTLYSFTYKDSIAVDRRYYPVKPSKRLIAAVRRISENPPSNDIELALAPSMGPTLVRALALVSDVIYSVPVSREDPVSLTYDPFAYTYTIGGKDGVPYPFDSKTARELIEYLREAIENVSVEGNIKKRSLKRLAMLVKRRADMLGIGGET